MTNRIESRNYYATKDGRVWKIRKKSDDCVVSSWCTKISEVTNWMEYTEKRERALEDNMSAMLYLTAKEIETVRFTLLFTTSSMSREKANEVMSEYIEIDRKLREAFGTLEARYEGEQIWELK